MSQDTKDTLWLLAFIVGVVVLIFLVGFSNGEIVIPGLEGLPVYAEATASARYRSTSSAAATQTATVNAPYTIEANGIRIERFTDKENGNSIYVCRQIKYSDPKLDPVVPCQFQTNPGD